MENVGGRWESSGRYRGALGGFRRLAGPCIGTRSKLGRERLEKVELFDVMRSMKRRESRWKDRKKASREQPHVAQRVADRASLIARQNQGRRAGSGGRTASGQPDGQLSRRGGEAVSRAPAGLSASVTIPVVLLSILIVADLLCSTTPSRAQLLNLIVWSQLVLACLVLSFLCLASFPLFSLIMLCLARATLLNPFA